MNHAATRAPDRRTRKSRAALQQALLSLIATRPYDEITIEDVTEQADVARATFYAHYKDKTALLNEASTGLVTELAERVRELAPGENESVYTGAAVHAIFRHAEEHADLYRLLISGDGVRAARAQLVSALEAATTDIFHRITAAPVRTPRLRVDRTATAFVGALLLTLEHWLEEAPREAAAAATAEFLRGQVGGMEWALGLAAGESRFEPQLG